MTDAVLFANPRQICSDPGIRLGLCGLRASSGNIYQNMTNCGIFVWSPAVFLRFPLCPSLPLSAPCHSVRHLVATLSAVVIRSGHCARGTRSHAGLLGNAREVLLVQQFATGCPGRSGHRVRRGVSSSVGESHGHQPQTQQHPSFVCHCDVSLAVVANAPLSFSF